MEESLWPEEIFDEKVIEAPVQIMQTQAAILSERMARVITAKVYSFIPSPSRWSPNSPSVVINQFELHVPAFGDYSLELFRVIHSPTLLYPATVFSSLIPDDDPMGEPPSAEDPTQLRAMLSVLFQQKEIKGVINTLRAQVAVPEARPPKRSDAARRAKNLDDGDVTSPAQDQDEEIPF